MKKRFLSMLLVVVMCLQKKKRQRIFAGYRDIPAFRWQQTIRKLPAIFVWIVQWNGAAGTSAKDMECPQPLR